MLNKCINIIQSVFYPPTCLLCGQAAETAQNLCNGCATVLPLNRNCCEICAMPLHTEQQICAHCQKQTPAFDSSFIPFRYQSPLDFLVSDFKFRNQLASGELLAQLFCQQLVSHQIPLPDLIIAVPLHPTRLRQRGFNQAQLLASNIGRQLGIAVNRSIATRKHNTASQHELSRKQRRSNMRGAFLIAKTGLAAHIAIVDDVVTTGSTANELARRLKAAGAKNIQVWAMARTPQK